MHTRFSRRPRDRLEVHHLLAPRDAKPVGDHDQLLQSWRRFHSVDDVDERLNLPAGVLAGQLAEDSLFALDILGARATLLQAGVWTTVSLDRLLKEGGVS